MFPAGVAFPAGAAGGDMMLTEMAPRSSSGDATPVCGSDSLPSFWMSHHRAGPGARGLPSVVPSWHWAHRGKAITRWHYHPFQGRGSWLSFSGVNYLSARGHILVAVSRRILENLSL